MKHFARILTIAALALFGFGAQAEEAILPDGTPLRLRYAVHPLSEPLSAEALASQAAAGTTIPLWSAKVASLGKTFTYTMVGQNPQIKLSNQATTVPLVIVPIKFIFANGDVFDPSAADPTCSPTGTPLSLFLQSPILRNVTLTSNGKKVVTGQYSDVFQFANFYHFTKPGGLNPHFSITFKPKVLATVALKVSASGGTVEAANCGPVGLIDINSWISFVQTSLFKQLKASLTPTTVPFFLFYNIFMCDNAGCGIGGFHDAFLNPNYGKTLQTYGTTLYDTTQLFRSSADVVAAGHELDELQDDPTGTNPTPAWGHVGQVSGCQNNLEVGDPLSGTIFDVKMPNGFTYHVQDLAFFSWFYRQSPSIGLGGLYSLLGTFTQSAGAVCH
jgi:hypothetical protein